MQLVDRDEQAVGGDRTRTPGVLLARRHLEPGPEASDENDQHRQYRGPFRVVVAADPFGQGFVTLLLAGKWLPHLVVHPPRRPSSPPPSNSPAARWGYLGILRGTLRGTLRGAELVVGCRTARWVVYPAHRARRRRGGR